MSIHPSHSKSELTQVVEIFNLNVVNYKNLNKKDLSKELLYQLSKIENVEPDDDYFFIKNKKELLDYLINPDCSKVLTIKEKDRVIELAKYIIMYVKNGFYLSYSPFLDYGDLIKQAKYISQYSDIPTVYRAIQLINTDAKLKNKIEPILSSKRRKQLERKKRIKQRYRGGLIIKSGKFVVDFT